MSIPIVKNPETTQESGEAHLPYGTTPPTPGLCADHHHHQKAAAAGVSPSLTAMTAYLRNLLGLNAKPTKRTLSEEAECGSPDSLSEWLRLGSDPNEVDAYGYTPLINACLRGCIKSVKFLIEHGACVNKTTTSHGYTPLHAAAQNGFLEIVELLVEHGADMEVKNNDADTPLMLAVRSDHPAVVDLLCRKGCDLHTHGFDNIEPIDYAIHKRNLYLSDVLMKHERQHCHDGHHDAHHAPHQPLHHHSDNNNNSLEPIKEHP